MQVNGCTQPVDNDVGEGRGRVRGAQDVRRVHAITLELRQDAVADAVAADLGHDGGCEAQARGGRERVGAVAAALRLHADAPCSHDSAACDEQALEQRPVAARGTEADLSVEAASTRVVK